MHPRIYPLPTGSYNVTVTTDGYVTPDTRTVAVTTGATKTVSFELERMPTPARDGSGGGYSDLSAGAANGLSAGENADSYYYTAKTPGFSIFAITAEHGTAAMTPPAIAPATTPATAGPTPTQSPVPYGCAILAAGLLCLMKIRRE